MPDYIARVVLHRTDGSNDYEDFHEEMLKRGFSLNIHGYDPLDRKVVNRLPGGTYYFDSKRASNINRNYSAREAYEAVVEAVFTVMEDETRYIKASNTPPSVLVTKCEGPLWSGLRIPPIKFNKS